MSDACLSFHFKDEEGKREGTHLMSRSQLMIKLKPKPGFLDFYDNVPSKVISIWTASNGISEMVDLFAVMSSVARLSHSIAEERSNIK